MTISLVVEDGTLVSGANSYISLADAQTYWGNWNYSLTGFTTTQQTNALYAAGYAMDKLYGRFYIGRTSKFSPQAMLWPRQFDRESPTGIMVQDTTGSGAQFYVRVIDGAVSSVSVLKGGYNYTAPLLSVWDLSGTGAAVTATVAGGAITAVTVTNSGSRYVTPSEITANDHTSIDINEIPQCLKDAQCEIAYISLTGGDIFPELSDQRKLKQRREQIGTLNFIDTYNDPLKNDGERLQGFRKVELVLAPIITSQHYVYA